MPSLHRPNAPNRLPSEDFGDLFIKPRALRISEAKSLIATPSPLSTPAQLVTQRRAFRSSDADVPIPSSPLASPRVLVRPRRQQHAERPSYRSTSSPKSGSSREAARSSSGSPYAIEEEPMPLKTRTSSMSDKARKILGIADIVHPGLSDDVEQVPREARAGFKWKRDFLGGWLEVRVGRESEPDSGRSGNLDEMARNLSTATTLPRRLSDATDTADASTQNTDDRLLPDGDSNTTSTLGPLSEGLYCRTKRVLGLKKDPISPYLQPRSRTPTGAVLDRVTSTLRFLPSRQFSVSTSAASSVSNLSIAAPKKQRHGRRNRLDSSSSSVRDLLMGRPPAGTPKPEALYIGSDFEKYLSVDMTQPDAPDFLPSEARRINTPSLPSASGLHGSRGFFFDYEPPVEELQTDIPKQTLLPRNSDTIAPRPARDDWCRTQLNVIDAGGVATRDEIEVSIPEHYPNSPLCPRNPKHRSGGMGTCPYHGRNKSTPSDVATTPTLGKTGTLSPVPETWWTTS